MTQPIDTQAQANFLEELLSEEPITTQANSTQQVDDPLQEMLDNDSEVFSLDDLLAESLEAAAEAKASKELLRKIREGRASPAEAARVKEIELKAAWTPVASCEMWEQVNCECGHTHATFSHYMTEYRLQHAGPSAARRWVKTEPEATYDHLPKKAIYSQREVFHCSECSEPPADAEIVIWANTAASPAQELTAADGEEPGL